MWRVVSVSGNSAELDSREKFGHIFTMRAVLEYRPPDNPGFEPFQEPPSLVWNEKIFLRDHGAKTYWDWSGELYSLKRNRSMTFKPWRARYIEAYNSSVAYPTGPSQAMPGRVELFERFDEKERPVRFAHLPGQPVPRTDAEKAEVVRRYISRNVCRLVVEIHDRPAININPSQPNWSKVHKERLLLFYCGVGGKRIRASQYLNVKGSEPKAQWQSSFQGQWLRTGLPTYNYKRTFAPLNYSFEGAGPSPGQFE
jgi:hypothetical protein